MHRNRTWQLSVPELRTQRNRILPIAGGVSPSLALDFSSGTLDPRITFTRSTIGTYYRGAFNQNLVTQSETFSTWTQFQNVSNNASSEQNPFGTGTSRVIQDDATNAAHRLLANNVTFVAGQTYTQSVYAKAGTGTAIQILFGSTEFGLNEWATFNLSNGTIGSVGTSVSGSDASIQPIGNGWYRCSLTATCTTGGTNVCAAIHLTNSQSTTTRAPAYSGSGQTVFLWGAQTTEGSLLTPYIPTTTAAITQGQIAASQPWNLVLQSQAFDNTTTWGNLIGGTGVTPVRTANNATAPDGTMTADTITFDVGSGVLSADRSMLSQTVTGLLSGRQYTLSFWIRSPSGTAQLNVRHVGGVTHTLVTATTTWQRVTITETDGGGASVQIGIRQAVNGTINATATVELWGAQLNEGATALDYNPTTTQANYLPRFEYNPVSGAFRGLLIEGGITNLCIRSEEFNTWAKVAAGDIVTANAGTSPDGLVTADKIIADTTSGAHGVVRSVTTTGSTTYTQSVFVKAAGWNWVYMTEGNTLTATAWFNLANGTVGTVSGTGTPSADIQPIGNDWYRCTLTFTTNAGQVNANIQVRPTTGNNVFTGYVGNGVDGVLAWGAQMEAQSFASSYIPTVAATVARGADLADITGSAFSSWFNQSEGTLYAEQQVYALIGNSAAAFIQQDGSNYYEIGQGVASLSADMVRFYVQLAGGNDVVLTTTLTGLSVGNTIRSAAAYRVNDVAFSGNANTVQTDNTFTIQTPVSMGLGRPRVGVSRSILLRRISYWPTRLPNDQLVSLTTIPSTALAMTAIQAGAKIDLTWMQVPGVEGAIYEVERSTNGGATWSPLTTSFGLAFNDTTALFPGTYTYRVRANVGGEVTDWSSQVSETTVDVPSAPGSLTVTGATTSSISLSWTDSTGEDSYGIEVSPDGLGSWSLAGTASANTTTFTHTPLAESVQRYYRVNGINKAGGGVYSSTVNSWTVPLAPTSLTATAVSSSQIDLAWTDVSTGNQSYKVERSTDNVNWTQIATGLAANATSYSAVGLTGSTLYYFRVRAANAARDSAYSNTASATTQAGGLVPAWSLDFSSGSPWANGTNYTYSSLRTAGTYVDSSGYIAPNAANLVLQSEDFSTTWTNNLTTESLSGTAPDGSATSWRIQESIGNGGHNIVSGWHTKAATTITYTISCYVKKDSTNPCDYVAVTGQAFNENSYGVLVDLSNGSVTDTYSSGTPNGSHSVTNVGSGWYRVSLTMTSTTATLLRVVIGTHRTATATWSVSGPTYSILSGSTLLNLLAWGAQIVVGSDALPYSKTTTAANGIPRLMHNSSGSRLGLLVEGQRTNLAQYSEAVNLWSLAGTTVPATNTTAPDNTATADTMQETTVLSRHLANPAGIVVSANIDYSWSVFLKKATRQYALLHVGYSSGSNVFAAMFNLDNGTVSATLAAGTGSLTASGVENYGNGWYRCWVVGKYTSGATTFAAVGMSDRSDFSGTLDRNFPSYTGSTAEQLYVWGAQFEQASNPSSYIPVAGTTTVTRSADLAHVLDSAITSWGDPGALVVHFYPPLNSGTLISTDDASTAQVGIEASTATDVRAFWSSGSTAAETMTTGVQKAVHYWTGSTSKLCLNGGAVRSGTNNFTIANADFVTLGAEATDSAGVPGTFSQYANCVIRKVEFYSGTLTDANLQTITT